MSRQHPTRLAALATLSVEGSDRDRSARLAISSSFPSTGKVAAQRPDGATAVRMEAVPQAAYRESYGNTIECSCFELRAWPAVIEARRVG